MRYNVFFAFSVEANSEDDAKQIAIELAYQDLGYEHIYQVEEAPEEEEEYQEEEEDKPAVNVGDRMQSVKAVGDYHGVVKSWIRQPDGWMIVLDLGTNLMAFYEDQLEWED